MSARATLDPWQAAFDAHAGASAEPAWLRARREAGLASFRRLGLPTTRDEDWQKTNVSHLTRSAWSPAPRPGPDALETAAALLDEDLGRLAAERGRMVFVNGWFAPSLSRIEGLPPGVTMEELAGEAPRLESELYALVDGSDQAFQALNAALWTNGARLRVERGVQLVEPLHLVFLVVGGDEHDMVHSRALVHLAAGSRAPLLVTWAGRTEAHALQNAVLEIDLGEGSRLDLLEDQRLPHTVQHFEGLTVRQARGSTFAACGLASGAKLARTDATVRLDDEDAHCRLDGVAVVSTRQHVDVLTRMDHATPHGTSEQLYKGILDDHASTAFSGKVLVRPGAQKTDARQANHNLLLSRDAVADSKPQLEIFADDVKCAHGATVGQLDDEAVFYLRSRGLGLLEARKILVKAFAAEVVERVEHPALHEHARSILHAIL